MFLCCSLLRSQSLMNILSLSLAHLCHFCSIDLPGFQKSWAFERLINLVEDRKRLSRSQGQNLPLLLYQVLHVAYSSVVKEHRVVIHSCQQVCKTGTFLLKCIIVDIPSWLRALLMRFTFKPRTLFFMIINLSQFLYEKMMFTKVK